MTTRVIFLCPHNAAKSVASAAFLARDATSRGLEVEITTAGTDPDAEVLPIVRAHLEEKGLPVGGPPRMVTAEDLSAADHIINIGCPHDALPTDQTITDWAIPNFSDDPVVAFAAITSHVEALADELERG